MGTTSDIEDKVCQGDGDVQSVILTTSFYAVAAEAADFD
jgi:hypothetical protein